MREAAARKTAWLKKEKESDRAGTSTKEGDLEGGREGGGEDVKKCKAREDWWSRQWLALTLLPPLPPSLLLSFLLLLFCAEDCE